MLPIGLIVLCIFGQPAVLLDRMPSGRAGHDALLVQRPAGEPFFVLVPTGAQPGPCR